MIKLNFIEFVAIAILILVFTSMRVELKYYLQMYYSKLKSKVKAWPTRFTK